MLKVYVAIKAFYKGLEGKTVEGHVTLAFMDIKETKALNFFYSNPDELHNLPVISVEYWKDSDVTVATLKFNRALEVVKEEIETSGFTYNDYEFIPHVTLSRGNKTEEYKYLLEEKICLHHTYLRIKDFK